MTHATTFDAASSSARRIEGSSQPGRRGDDDRVDELAAIEAVEALGQQRPSAESGERLRTIDAEPLAGAGGRDQRPDTPALGGNV